MWLRAGRAKCRSVDWDAFPVVDTVAGRVLTDAEVDKLSGSEVLAMIKFGAESVFAGGNREPPDAELERLVPEVRKVFERRPYFAKALLGMKSDLQIVRKLRENFLAHHPMRLEDSD